MGKKQSPSSRRAWIEILRLRQRPLPDHVALLAEGVDRNALADDMIQTQRRSPSSRRAWIEMSCPATTRTTRKVALLAEGVDRNHPVRQRHDLRRRRPPRGGRG